MELLVAFCRHHYMLHLLTFKFVIVVFVHQTSISSVTSIELSLKLSEEKVYIFVYSQHISRKKPVKPNILLHELCEINYGWQDVRMSCQLAPAHYSSCYLEKFCRNIVLFRMNRCCIFFYISDCKQQSCYCCSKHLNAKRSIILRVLAKEFCVVLWV